MGYNFALMLGALEAAEPAGIDAAVAIHLAHNVNPPITEPAILAVCVEAVERALAEDYAHAIALPEGVRYRGQPSAPVAAIVEGFRLAGLVDGFISATEPDDMEAEPH